MGICVTPMLPLGDREAFIRRLVEFSPDVLVVQDFHDSGGGFGADTGDTAWRLREGRRWGADDYRDVRDRLRREMTVYEAEAGFFPPGPAS